MKNIEVMAYYYTYDDNDEYGLVPILYSSVDQNGIVKTIRKRPASTATFSVSEIDEDLLNRVISKTENKSEKDFKVLFDSTSIKLDCGPVVRIRITNDDGKYLSFLINRTATDGRFLDFLQLYDNLSSDTLTRLRNINEINQLLAKQQQFKKFSFHKDSINLPFPPPPAPKIDEVKFVRH